MNNKIPKYNPNIIPGTTIKKYMYRDEYTVSHDKCRDINCSNIPTSPNYSTTCIVCKLEFIPYIINRCYDLIYEQTPSIILQ